MNHINISKQHPEVYKQVAALSEAAGLAATSAGLDPQLIELVKIRVSQINGCAFCARLHTRDSIAAGETADRLAVLSTWRESQYFSATEEAALGLAEEVTHLAPAQSGTVDTHALTAEQVSAVTWLAITMAAWNRVAIRSGYRVAP